MRADGGHCSHERVHWDQAGALGVVLLKLLVEEHVVSFHTLNDLLKYSFKVHLVDLTSALAHHHLG